MRRYATVIAVVLCLLLLSAGHRAAATPGQSYGDGPLKGATVASKDVGEKAVVTSASNPLVGAQTAAVYPVSEEDAAAALVTGWTGAMPQSSPQVRAVESLPDSPQWYQAVPWIPDEPAPSKSQPAAQVKPHTPSNKGGVSPEAQVKPHMPAKAIEVDYYSSQPQNPQMPPTVAAVETDYSATQPSKTAPKAAAVSGTQTPVTPAVSSSQPAKQYSPAPATPAAVSSSPSVQYSPATPAAVPSSPSKQSSPATPAAVSLPSFPATPVAVSSPSKQSSSPATPAVAVSPPSKQYSPATNPSSSNAQASVELKDGLNEKAINDIVKEHNVFRYREKVPPIQWNATLAKYAQEYAEERRGDCKLEHSTGPYGENMMFGTGKEWTWKKTVDEWSDEKSSYDYNSNSCQAGKQCAHYTAVVWRNTTGVGCGRVVCASGDTIMVCSYWPPGNYDGVKPF
ncbi:hypothetical protein E2562_037463 [Oryza meyeriana var. granulata]|uniref:SCP domain-containing protein n=1 Tax=Oryza meyeriana var. granulata TaxID=110450 RepID=A0A6G1DSL0_9ORYZ|nr:hypothetical protein E2562_037463 [Oryza meyeriana var. granulata]